MKIQYWVITLLICIGLVSCNTKRNVSSSSSSLELSLKEVLHNKFLIGVALNTRQTAGIDTNVVNIVKKHFNSIVAENCMKSAVIHPKENHYNFAMADNFIKFGEKYKMAMIGHCLIWHSQLPSWFCTDKSGKNISPDILKQRMREHIHTIVSRYKGKIKGWDVVNEAITGDGSFRETKFYEILGEDYIPLAFTYAHEADPNAELYYNDYGMDTAEKRNAVVRLIKSLKAKNIRIDAVGMQGHMGMDYPDIREFEKSMLAFASTGVKVMITEWDMSALPTVSRGANIADTVAAKKILNPYPVSLPDSISRKWNKRMGDFMNLFIKHADIVTRVTAWGVTDGDSWKNNFPVRGRHEYPLLFDRQYLPKPFIVELLHSNKD